MRSAGLPSLMLALAVLARPGLVAIAAPTAAPATVATPAGVRLPSGMAGRLIAHFKMQRIPQEGAWFAVSYTSDDVYKDALLPSRYAGHPHAAGGAIVALMTPQDFSALHRLQTDEVWHFYSGAPLEMLLLYPDGEARTVILGNHVLGGELAQFTVPKGVWQGAAPLTATPRSFSFVGTQMAPGFDPSDFEIGYRDELARRYPGFAKHIGRLTRSEFAVSPDAPTRVTDQHPTQSRVVTDEDVPAVTPSPGVNFKELVGRVAPLAQTSMLSVAKFTLLPGLSSGTSFNHRSQEVFLVIGGTGEVHLGDAVTQVHAGSTVFIPAGEVHSIEADPTSTLTFYAVSAPAYSPDDYVGVAPR